MYNFPMNNCIITHAILKVYILQLLIANMPMSPGIWYYAIINVCHELSVMVQSSLKTVL